MHACAGHWPHAVTSQIATVLGDCACLPRIGTITALQAKVLSDKTVSVHGSTSYI